MAIYFSFTTFISVTENSRPVLITNFCLKAIGLRGSTNVSGIKGTVDKRKDDVLIANKVLATRKENFSTGF